MSNRNEPVPQTDRITSLDVLRGFALLGILMVNIQSFGLIDAKYLNPTAMGELEGMSYGSWWITFVFFDSKFMAIFSLLFGASIVLMWQRNSQADRKSAWLHYRRMFWLLLFGLTHAHLLWFGDILFLYSICGMTVYWLCGLKPRWLIPLGLSFVAVASGISILIGFSLPYWDEPQMTEMIASWSPTLNQVEENLAIYRGNWLEQLTHRSLNALFMETFLLIIWGFWRAGGLMLIGMGFFKLGIFNAERSNRFYLIGAMFGLLFGLGIIITGIGKLETANWSFEYSYFFGTQFNYWGSLFICFAYVCIVMLFCRNGWLKWLQKSLAATGQLALTNYLLQTMVCTTLFYGHGFGWYGYLSRSQLVGFVLVFWVLQMIGSPLWLKKFRFGPFEWLWRSLSYWRLQPMLKA